MSHSEQYQLVLVHTDTGEEEILKEYVTKNQHSPQQFYDNTLFPGCMPENHRDDWGKEL